MKDWDTFINRRRGTDYNQDAADDDPPPPYEALPQSEVSISNASPSGSTRRITFSATNQRTSYRRPERALQYYTPHPNHVKCRCGQYNDTTQQSWQLPPGKVRCYCGYIVMASGYSCHPSQDNETCRVQCSCGSLVLNQHHEHQFSCSCGAEFRSDGSVRRLCVYHGTYANDACNVRCTCGKYVDTTAEWTIKHGRSNTGKDRVREHPFAGYSKYEYNLPRDSGRCSCGRTISRDGTCMFKHNSVCCRVGSVSKREVVAGSVESCTCAYL